MGFLQDIREKVIFIPTFKLWITKLLFLKYQIRKPNAKEATYLHFTKYYMPTQTEIVQQHQIRTTSAGKVKFAEYPTGKQFLHIVHYERVKAFVILNFKQSIVN